MKTRELIIHKAIELFNLKGTRNVTLREVALEINKSYGNVTYHFSTKEKLLEAVFEDYNNSLLILQNNDMKIENILHYFLVIPDFSFEITVKYLFFFIDYTEIKRAYPNFIIQVEQKNKERQQKWKKLLLELKKQAFLKSELSEKDINFIMELSTGLRMYYFQSTPKEFLDQSKFSYKVNQLLFPYLSKKGIDFYIEFYS